MGNLRCVQTVFYLLFSVLIALLGEFACEELPDEIFFAMSVLRFGSYLISQNSFVRGINIFGFSLVLRIM
jgi:hypothetical protein